ncbi:hypothetical protein ABNG02_13750 [Halorubrum ejinorense]|uniref:Uncharacterized protein n=1 Tax=Halorubrum ejinorense TaxID=425309 RepID=A0AAV3SSM7_9EURY
MSDGETIFTHLTSQAVHVLRATILTVLYAGLALSFSGGALGLLGVYLIFTSGILPWYFSGLHKQERILILVVIASIGIIQAIASLWVHPILSTSVVFVAGNVLLNNGENVEKYDALGDEYWPVSILLVPFGLVGWILASPISIVIWFTDFISWMSDMGDTTEQATSGEPRDKSAPTTQSQPQQRLETVQRSGQTAEDINNRRPDEPKETSTGAGSSSPFEN